MWPSQLQQQQMQMQMQQQQQLQQQPQPQPQPLIYPYQRQHQHQPPPPLTMPSHMPQQMPQHHYGYDGQPQMQQHFQQQAYDMQHPPAAIPPSPREEAGKDKETDYTNLPGPEATCNAYQGYIYMLKWVQQPIRARMCGFGDKDRRPISPPPCIRLVVVDKESGKEVDANALDISYFVLQVDLWDKEGLTEKNLVKHAQVSPSISTATTTSYPPTITRMPVTHAMPQPYDPATLAAHQGGTNGHSNSGYSYSNGSTTNGQPQMYGSHYADNSYNAQGHHAGNIGYPPPPPGRVNIPPISSFTSSTMPSPYAQSRRGYRDDDLNSPQTTGMFTRNLIGSLTTNACLLKDENKVAGIWFILQDLSVRTEDWFRLKATFFNLGVPTSAGTQGNGSSLSLTKQTVPTLAEVFSQPFQVFSAKKFPGVIESTELSKEFAKQGVKIPIRKEAGGSKRRPSNDEEEYLEED